MSAGCASLGPFTYISQTTLIVLTELSIVVFVTNQNINSNCSDPPATIQGNPVSCHMESIDVELYHENYPPCIFPDSSYPNEVNGMPLTGLS